MARKYQKRRAGLDEADDIKDGIVYDRFGRMEYHPKFHPNHKKPFTLDEAIYLCKFYDFEGTRNMAFALGRTEKSLIAKVNELRKSGEFQKYRDLSLGEWEEAIR